MGRRVLDWLIPSAIITVTVGAVFATFVFVATAPIVTALAGLRYEMHTLFSADADGMAGVGHRGIDFIVKLGQTIQQVTPERKEQLRAAIRTITHEIDVIVDVTGSVEFGAHVILEAFKHGKSVVLMNGFAGRHSIEHLPHVALSSPFTTRNKSCITSTRNDVKKKGMPHVHHVLASNSPPLLARHLILCLSSL